MDIAQPGNAARDRFQVSFEIFPPKTESGERSLQETITALGQLAPDFISVTFGAGGSSQNRTVSIAREISTRTEIPVVGHLTCVGSTKDQLVEIIEDYRRAGVRTILALRGDPPEGVGSDWQPTPGGLDHADQLVSLIVSLGAMRVGVAAFPEGHPESDSLDQDARVLAAKQEAGAEFAITQLFFRASDYFRLVERAREHGCTMPIVPGIMPVTNVGQVERFAQICGSEFPAPLAERFHAVADDPAAIQEVGVDVAVSLCEELVKGGAPGLHFYTLNKSPATREIYQRLQATVTG